MKKQTVVGRISYWDNEGLVDEPFTGETRFVATTLQNLQITAETPRFHGQVKVIASPSKDGELTWMVDAESAEQLGLDSDVVYYIGTTEGLSNG